MITPQQFRNPQVKPKWQLPVGVMESVVAYNCRKYGMPRPVLAMPMWEGAGNRALDYSGHGNHGILTNGPDWVASGLDFGGTDEYVTGTINIDFSVSDYSFVFGLHTDTISNSNKGIISIGNIPFDAIPAILFQRDLGVLKYLPGGAGLGYLNVGTLAIDKEHTVAVTYDNNDHIRYLDGKHTYTTTGNSSNVVDNDFYIGAGYSGYHDGGFSYVYIYDVSLFPAQVKFLYDNPYFMYEIPEELYGYVSAVAAEANPYWYYQMLKRRN